MEQPSFTVVIASWWQVNGSKERTDNYPITHCTLPSLIVLFAMVSAALELVPSVTAESIKINIWKRSSLNLRDCCHWLQMCNNWGWCKLLAHTNECYKHRKFNFYQSYYEADRRHHRSTCNYGSHQSAIEHGPFLLVMVLGFNTLFFGRTMRQDNECLWHVRCYQHYSASILLLHMLLGPLIWLWDHDLFQVMNYLISYSWYHLTGCAFNHNNYNIYEGAHFSEKYNE